MAFNKKSL